MRTASGLSFIAIGAILAFAVTASTPFVNVHIVGWVLILTGIVGLLVPRKGYGWLRRRLVLRPGPRGTAVRQFDETRYPRSILRYPDSAPTDDPGEGPSWRPGGWLGGRSDPLQRRARSEVDVREPVLPGESETIEEFSQE